MGTLIAIALLALSWMIICATIRSLRRSAAPCLWWIGFTALSAGGLLAGWFFAFRFEYQVSPTMRCLSFPMPLSFLRLEDGRWIDFVTPPYVLFPGLAANVFAMVAVALLPLWVASRQRGKKAPTSWPVGPEQIASAGCEDLGKAPPCEVMSVS